MSRIRTLLALSLASLLAACSRAPDGPTPPATPTAPVLPTKTETTPVGQPQPPALATQPAPSEAPDMWVLPGALGPLTTETELARRFGKQNVHEMTLPGPEGEQFPALVLYPDDAQQRLELLLDPQDRDAPIQELRVRGVESRWHADNGLHPGMRLADLVQRNGAPITFYGFGWDYGGTVQDWHGGKLANAVGTRAFHRVRLGLSNGATPQPLPQGESGYRSDDPRWPGLDKQLVITELGISWPEDDE